MGEIHQNIDIVTIVNDHRVKPAPAKALPEGNVTRCKLFTNIDNERFNLAAERAWEPNAKYRVIDFDKRPVRFIKIEVLEANGRRAIIAELEAGRSE